MDTRVHGLGLLIVVLPVVDAHETKYYVVKTRVVDTTRACVEIRTRCADYILISSPECVQARKERV